MLMWGFHKDQYKLHQNYAQGMVVLTASAWLPGLTPKPEDEGPAKWWQGAMLFGALYIVALGTGGMPSAVLLR